MQQLVIPVAMQGVSKAHLLSFTLLLLHSASAISIHTILSESSKPFQSGIREKLQQRRRNHPICSSRGRLAYMIPDVEWWNSNAIGWTGSVPQQDIPAHGLLEQVYSGR
jgi:hypothetical protein